MHPDALKALVEEIAKKTGIPKIDVLLTLTEFFKATAKSLTKIDVSDE